MHLQEPMRSILPLQTAIRKLQPSSEYLTAIHADFLQLCLLSKCYKASLSILEDDIFEIDQKRTALVPRDFLLYCYYGYALYEPLTIAKYLHRYILFLRMLEWAQIVHFCDQHLLMKVSTIAGE